jgi:hypothetical protein
MLNGRSKRRTRKVTKTYKLGDITGSKKMLDYKGAKKAKEIGPTGGTSERKTVVKTKPKTKKTRVRATYGSYHKGEKAEGFRTETNKYPKMVGGTAKRKMKKKGIKPKGEHWHETGRAESSIKVKQKKRGVKTKTSSYSQSESARSKANYGTGITTKNRKTKSWKAKKGKPTTVRSSSFPKKKK